MANNPGLAQDLQTDADQLEEEAVRSLARNDRAIEDFAYGAPSAFDLAGDGVSLIRVSARTEDGSLGTITWANPAALRMLGYASSQREFLGRDMSVMLPPPVAAVHGRFLHTFVGDGVSRMTGQSRQLFFAHRAGHLVPVLLHVHASGEEFLVAAEEVPAAHVGFVWFLGGGLNWRIVAACRNAHALLGFSPNAARSGHVSLETYVAEPARAMMALEGRPDAVLQLRGLPEDGPRFGKRRATVGAAAGFGAGGAGGGGGGGAGGGAGGGGGLLSADGSFLIAGGRGEMERDKAYASAAFQAVIVPHLASPLFVLRVRLVSASEAREASGSGRLVAPAAFLKLVRDGAAPPEPESSLSAAAAPSATGDDLALVADSDHDDSDSDAGASGEDAGGAGAGGGAGGVGGASKAPPRGVAAAAEAEDVLFASAPPKAAPAAQLRSALRPGAGAGREESLSAGEAVKMRLRLPALPPASAAAAGAGAEADGEAATAEKAAPGSAKAAAGVILSAFAASGGAASGGVAAASGGGGGGGGTGAGAGGGGGGGGGRAAMRSGASVGSGASAASGGSLTPAEMLRRGVTWRGTKLEESLVALRGAVLSVFVLIAAMNIVSYTVTNVLFADLLANFGVLFENAERAVFAQQGFTEVQNQVLANLGRFPRTGSYFDWSNERIRTSVNSLEGLHRSLYLTALKDPVQKLKYIAEDYTTIDLEAGTFIDRDNYDVLKRNLSLTNIVLEYITRQREFWWYPLSQVLPSDADTFW